MPYKTGVDHWNYQGGLKHNKEYRKAYVKQWRLDKVAVGHYGICTNCNGPLGRNEGTKRVTTLCRDCLKGELSSNWKGGYTNSDGYIIVQTGVGRGNRIAVLQHRLVMEQHLGRKLYKDENVHHINGVRSDNRIENLELWSSSQPSGQRVEDKLAWAKEILRRYDV